MAVTLPRMPRVLLSCRLAGRALASRGGVLQRTATVVPPGSVRALGSWRSMASAAVEDRAVAESMFADAGSPAPLAITEAAAQVSTVKMRGGCGGHQYHFAFTEEAPSDSDVVLTRGDAAVVVDGRSLGFMQGSTVDYQRTMMESGLTISDNPNATSGCGCGTSFALKDDDF
ncbi:isca2 [Symbiodinium sp. KB8]|nr:isca2 [Symbiodinium sp. KB8]